jgi:MFS family permease
MELDALKEKWAEHDRKLDVSIRLNRQLLMAANMNRVRSPLRRLAFFVGLGALIGLIGPVILGQFIYQHWAEPRFVLPAVVLHVWVIANLAASIRQIAMALQIDYDKPIAMIQKQLESLRVLRIRITQWALLTGQVVWWIPFLIVALKGFWDLDAYKVFGTAFLLANLAVGLAIIPLAIWVSRKFGDRMGRSPVMQRLMRELAGYNLNAATGFLATLSEFENETRDS